MTMAKAAVKKTPRAARTTTKRHPVDFLEHRTLCEVLKACNPHNQGFTLADAKVWCLHCATTQVAAGDERFQVWLDLRPTEVDEALEWTVADLVFAQVLRQIPSETEEERFRRHLHIEMVLAEG